MALKKPAPSRAWINVSVHKYPGADGTTKSAQPGDLITDAAADWPPKWVVDAGYIRPAPEEEEY